MAGTSEQIMSVVATNFSELNNLSIENGQLVFVKDKRLIALDLNGKRTIYDKIEVLKTDTDRKNILAPVNELFYFVLSTGILWTYNNAWIQVTTRPNQIIFMGTSLPGTGSPEILYVDKSNKTISIWNDSTKRYVIIGEETQEKLNAYDTKIKETIKSNDEANLGSAKQYTDNSLKNQMSQINSLLSNKVEDSKLAVKTTTFQTGAGKIMSAYNDYMVTHSIYTNYSGTRNAWIKIFNTDFKPAFNCNFAAYNPSITSYAKSNIIPMRVKTDGSIEIFNYNDAPETQTVAATVTYLRATN